MLTSWQTTLAELEQVIQLALQGLEARERQLDESERVVPAESGMPRVSPTEKRWEEQITACNAAVAELEGILRTQEIAWRDWENAVATWRASLQHLRIPESPRVHVDPSPAEFITGNDSAAALTENSDADLHRDSACGGEIDPLRGP